VPTQVIFAQPAIPVRIQLRRLTLLKQLKAENGGGLATVDVMGFHDMDSVGHSGNFRFFP
jgi:hypothetical protein